MSLTSEHGTNKIKIGVIIPANIYFNGSASVKMRKGISVGSDLS